jgi:hypothetical protein
MPFRPWDSVGNYAADPDLWGFCGVRTRSSTRLPGHQEHLGNANGAARRAGPDRGASFNAAASSCRAIMLSRDHWHVRVVLPPACWHLDEQQPGHRTAAPAHPGEALTTDPADVLLVRLVRVGPGGRLVSFSVAHLALLQVRSPVQSATGASGRRSPGLRAPLQLPSSRVLLRAASPAAHRRAMSLTQPVDTPSPAQPPLVSVAVHHWLPDVQVYAVLPV